MASHKTPLWIDRLYTTLLRAYPAAFRDDYAGEMRAAFRSRWREERQARGVLGVAKLWAAVLLDLLWTAPRVHGETLARDVRYAWRSLTRRQSLAFTAAALLTLALGIGAVTAVYTLVHAVLLAPLPFRDPGRVVRVLDINTARGIDDFTASTPNFLSWRQAAHSFSGLAALRGASANLTDGGEPERASGLAVSAEIWGMLGIRPVAGRSFVSADGEPGQAPVVMISAGLWKRRYGAAASAIGRTIEVNLIPHVIVGIAPQDVGFASDVDVWLPLVSNPDVDQNRGDRRLIVLGRLAPGVTLRQAQGDLVRIAAQLEREFPGANRGWSIRLLPVRDWIVDAEVSQRLRIVFAAVALLLLVAATNVASLQIARAVGRGHEIGVRIALGASRARLVRQMMTENLVLAAAGGAGGLALAWLGVRAAAVVLPASIPRLAGLSLDLPALSVAVVCIGATALVTGLLPARLAVRSGVHDVLQQAGRSTTGTRTPARHALVAVQLAVATALVVCAALLTQSLVRLQHVALGFGDPEHLLTTRITRSAASDEMLDKNSAFFDALVTEIRSLPGAAAAAVSSEVPFGDNTTENSIAPIPRSEGVPEGGVQANFRIVTGDYFATMQIPIRQGRSFAGPREPRHSMILSEGLARRLWPGAGAWVGRQVRMGNGQTFDVIGVVGDVRQLGLAEAPTPTMYMSTSWYLWPTMTLVVRTQKDPAALAQAVRQAVQRIDPHQPVSAFQTLHSAMSANVAAPRLNAFLLASFAGLALLLAVVGVAGVVGYAVSQRERELAVRLALGASPAQVMRHVMRGGFATSAIGILCGLGAALALGRTLSGVLYGVGAYDPLTFGATAAALLAAAAWACWLPARRVTSISPSLTLRDG